MAKRRHDMSEIYWPNKVSLYDFVSEIQDHLEPFQKNMEHLKETESKYIEEWFEIFGRWSEIQSEGWDVLIEDKKQ